MSAQPVTPSLTERVYRALRRDILSGALKPGDPIPVRLLARRYRASRTPIREALIRLAQEGFANIHPRRGVFATGVSLKELHEVFQVREMLEGFAARLACQNPDKQALDAFEEELGLARKSGRYQDLMAVGLKIHEWIGGASNNATLAGILETLHGHMTRIFAIFVANQTVAQEAYGQYQEIIDAIRDGKPDEAERAMQRHIALCREHLLRSV